MDKKKFWLTKPAVALPESAQFNQLDICDEDSLTGFVRVCGGVVDLRP